MNCKALLSRSLLLCASPVLLMSSCYTVKWHESRNGSGIERTARLIQPPPKSIYDAFSKFPNSTYAVSAISPVHTYKYDIAEKDTMYADPAHRLVFTDVSFKLLNEMPAGQVLCDIEFADKFGHKIILESVDIMRIVPNIETEKEAQYFDFNTKEFTRFGTGFRKELGEYRLINNTNDSEVEEAFERSYRVDLVNNCLDATKWEMQFTANYFETFHENPYIGCIYNPDRLISHSWFYFDKEIYKALVFEKNKNIYDPKLMDYSYNELSQLGEQVVIDFENYRQPLKNKIKTKMEEVGHETEKKVVAVDIESICKWMFGLLGSDTVHTYRSILEKKIKLGKFDKEGFYYTDETRDFDYDYLRYINNIELSTIDVQGSDCYVEIKLSGEYAPYTFTIGNLDLATLEEQRWYGLNAGINTYPKGRRYNPVQNTLVYDPDLAPADRKQYFLMTDTKTGKWINNQYKGVEKVILSYDQLDSNTLEIILISYERESPVWYGRVRLPESLRQIIRARRNMFAY